MFFNVVRGNHGLVRSRIVASNSCPEAQQEYYASVLAVLQHFGYDPSSFSGEKIHSLINVMTLHNDLHDEFDKLKLYFEATVSFVLVFFDNAHCVNV